MLQVNNLSKAYGDDVIPENVSFVDIEDLGMIMFLE